MSKNKAKFLFVPIVIALGIGLIAVVAELISSRKVVYTQLQEKESDVGGIGFGYLESKSIGDAMSSKPWITHVIAWDLDRDGLMDILACDGLRNEIRFLRQTGDGNWEERTLGQKIEGPVHVSPADIDGDGDDDLLVAAMGTILPNRERVGKAILMENLGGLEFENRVLLGDTERVTDARSADFDGDGDLDVLLGQFGYDQGAIRWLEQTASMTFEVHDVLLRSGTINTLVDDVDGDGDTDILALVSQEWEEVYCFINDGSGAFRSRVLWASTNQDYGSSGLALFDLDRDGDNDLLYSNGDGFDYSTLGPRPWHGVQWLENRGNGFFARKPVGLMSGAFSPIAVDIDRDGDYDILASSACNEWGTDAAYSLVCFENTGGLNFKARPLARSPTHIVTIAAADFDGDGFEEIVSGGFHAFPPWNDMSRIRIWDTKPNN